MIDNCLRFKSVDSLLKTRFLVSGSISVVYALRNGRINDRRGFGIKLHGFFIVSRFDYGVKLLDCGFYFRFVVLVHCILLCVYQNAFFCGFNVRHFIFSFDKFIFTVLLFYHNFLSLTRIF